jgi:predicted O-methyltransferase YrrM
MRNLNPLARARRAASRLRGAYDQFRSHRALAATVFQSGLGDSAWFLYGIARAQKPQVCVEIGSAQGKSACYVGLALKENGGGKVYAIDPHSATNWNDHESVESLDIIRRNIATFGLRDYVEVIRSTSQEAHPNWTRSIDLLFIDGDHSYEGVKRDFQLFVPHVNPFGFVVFHDTLWDLKPDPQYSRADMGVPRFVDELRRDGYPVLTLDQNFGVSLVQPTRGGVPLSGTGAPQASAAATD